MKENIDICNFKSMVHAGEEDDITARITLPVIYRNNQWIYISGEVKSDIPTNIVYSIRN